MNARRLPVKILAADEFACQRCGIIQRYNASRDNKPVLCRDCRAVLAYRDKPDPIPRDPNHCRRGHPWTPENTYIKPSVGRRECRTCRSKSFKAALKAANQQVSGGRDVV